MKKWFVTAWLTALLFVIGLLFWKNEWSYLLPTPVPKNYHPAGRGQLIDLKISMDRPDGPLFLHFFNPDCPCSRFNVSQFKKLVSRYGQSIQFIVVVVSGKPYTVSGIQKRFGLDIPVLFDTALALACGVYSTPQAVLLDARHRLYYRGNYNRSRYCTDEKTGFAQMAINGLLGNQHQMIFDRSALTPYGCPLPNCTKQETRIKP